jgi:Arc/MetJ-type ribon-helix-helix transcriptional regulator
MVVNVSARAYVHSSRRDQVVETIFEASWFTCLSIYAIRVVLMYAVSMTAKTRLSVTVDSDLVAASQAAVADGEAESVSAWVNDALRLKMEHDRRLRGIDDFIAAFEAEYGEITDEEMDTAYRTSKARAIVVRGGQVVSDGHSGIA